MAKEICITEKCSNKAEVGKECIACYNKRYDGTHRAATYKKCILCGKEKLESEFYKDRKQCKICYGKLKHQWGIKSGVINGNGRGSQRILIIDGKKQCSVCREFKPVNEFHKNKSSFSGLACDCKECCRDKYLRIMIRDEML